MLISTELSEQILELYIQIETKFGIKIGYSHPYGSFISESDDFIIYQTVEDYGKTIEDIKYGPIYFVEYNKYAHETYGIFSKYDDSKLDEKPTEKEQDFLINFYNWIKNGVIKIEEFREFKTSSGKIVKWKPCGDGKRYSVEIKHGNGWTTGFMKELPKIKEKYPEITSKIMEEFESGE